VISPEGCASILWKTAEKAPEAAAALGITADRLHKLGLVDNVIKEPLGGAHRDYAELMNTVKTTLEQQITQAQGMRLDDLLSRRFDRIMNYGQFIDKNK
jgi:acetyl-CoA carboxylase, carboxyl transferase, alpha subunit